jgi:hypothetical protein
VSTAAQIMLPCRHIISAAHIHFRSLNVTPAPPMLRRLLSLSILYVSVLSAGIPAVACADATPTQLCCPTAPGLPCGGGGADLTQGMPADVACCASGIPSASAISATFALPKIERHAERIDPPAAITVFAWPTIGTASARSLILRAMVSRFPSYSTLYLSTGRLRL